jgi:hypothetical protein
MVDLDGNHGICQQKDTIRNGLAGPSPQAQSVRSEKSYEVEVPVSATNNAIPRWRSVVSGLYLTAHSFGFLVRTMGAWRATMPRQNRLF